MLHLVTEIGSKFFIVNRLNLTKLDLFSHHNRMRSWKVRGYKPMIWEKELLCDIFYREITFFTNILIGAKLKFWNSEEWENTSKSVCVRFHGNALIIISIVWRTSSPDPRDMCVRCHRCVGNSCAMTHPYPCVVLMTNIYFHLTHLKLLWWRTYWWKWLTMTVPMTDIENTR